MFRLSKRKIIMPLFGVAGCLCMSAALIFGTPASAQDGTSSNTDEDEAIIRFKADLAQTQMLLENEIAALQKFAEWTAYLSSLADSDPHAALNQRLPMPACESTALEPNCSKMRALFVQYLGLSPSRFFQQRYPPQQ